jgi:hypothetical protein
MYIDTPEAPHPAYGTEPARSGPVLGQEASGTDDPTSARVRAAVRAALSGAADADPEREAAAERARLGALYSAVAARVTTLRGDGVRPERALLILKREANAAIDELTAAGCPADGGRVSEILRHVVRWSVEAYHRAD